MWSALARRVGGMLKYSCLLPDRFLQAYQAIHALPQGDKWITHYTKQRQLHLLIWLFVIFYTSPGNHKSVHSACNDAKRGNLGPIVCKTPRTSSLATTQQHFWGSLPVSKQVKRVELLTHNNYMIAWPVIMKPLIHFVQHGCLHPLPVPTLHKKPVLHTIFQCLLLDWLSCRNLG